MNKILNLIIIAGLLLIVLILAFVGYNVLSKEQAPANLATFATTGETLPTDETQSQDLLAPDFTVYDLEGNAHKLSDFRGKPVVLNFWASWCGPCKSEMPDFDQAFKTYGGEIHFLMVNLTDGYQETVETASAFISDSGYSFPVYYDSDMSAVTAYNINAVPVTYFIDADGYMVAAGQGALTAADLEEGIGMLIG